MELPPGGLIVAWWQLFCLNLLVAWRGIFGKDRKWLQSLADHGLHVSTDGEGSWQGHHEELLLHVAPAGEDEHVGKEEKDVTPLDVMAPQITDHVHCKQPDDEEEKEKPGKEETPAPGPESVAGKEVADRGHGGEETKETAVDDHSIPLLHLVRQCHRDQGDPGYQVANVKEEEKSEEGLGGPVDAGRLLVGPDGPQGGGEVPDGLHGDGGPLHCESPGSGLSARWRWW